MAFLEIILSKILTYFLIRVCWISQVWTIPKYLDLVYTYQIQSLVTTLKSLKYVLKRFELLPPPTGNLKMFVAKVSQSLIIPIFLFGINFYSVFWNSFWPYLFYVLSSEEIKDETVNSWRCKLNIEALFGDYWQLQSNLLTLCSSAKHRRVRPLWAFITLLNAMREETFCS